MGGNPVSSVDLLGLDDTDLSNDSPSIPDPSEPKEGLNNIKIGLKVYALGCSIRSYQGLIVKGLGGLFALTGLAQIAHFGYDEYKFNEYLQNQTGPFGTLNPDTPFGPANQKTVTVLCPGPGCGAY